MKITIEAEYHDENTAGFGTTNYTIRFNLEGESEDLGSFKSYQEAFIFLCKLRSCIKSEV